MTPSLIVANLIEEKREMQVGAVPERSRSRLPFPNAAHRRAARIIVAAPCLIQLSCRVGWLIPAHAAKVTKGSGGWR